MTTQDPNLGVVFNREIVLKHTYLKNASSGSGKTCFKNTEVLQRLQLLFRDLDCKAPHDLQKQNRFMSLCQTLVTQADKTMNRNVEVCAILHFLPTTRSTNALQT